MSQFIHHTARFTDREDLWIWGEPKDPNHIWLGDGVEVMRGRHKGRRGIVRGFRRESESAVYAIFVKLESREG